MTSSDPPGRYGYIDGIRALAVVAVMIYHLEPSLMPGGFVGVDVFFVISGFVVTASLAPHRQERLAQFLGGFYARRLARLIPALLTMLLATTLAYVLLVPKAWFNRAAESVGLASFWGISNWTLDHHAVNYFEPRAELNPFTHTWSLGVEEQFYLLAPLMLLAALRVARGTSARRVALVGIAGLAMFSLLACFYFGFTRGPRFVFYQVWFRFWELACGVLLFLNMEPIRRGAARFDANGVLSAVAGLLLIMLALLTPGTAAYPYLRASAAVIGALLLIGAAPATPRDPLRKALGSGVPVWLGARSYALYLWHWPVYVLARWTVGLTAWPMNFVAPALAVALAAASYRAIEHPIRTNPRLRARPAWQRITVFCTAVTMAWMLADQLLAHQPQLGRGKVTREAADWYADRQLVRTTLAAARRCEPVRETIDIGLAKGAGTRFVPRDCAVKAASQLFVMGDSHAIAYLPLLEQVSAEDGREVTVLSTPGCSFMNLKEALDPRDDLECYRAASDSLRVLLGLAKPGDVVFMAALRVPRLVELGGTGRRVAPNAHSPAIDIFERTRQEQAELERAVADAPRWLNPLLVAGLRVILEAPKPLFRAHPFACVEWWNRLNPECASGLHERTSDLERYRAPTLAALRRLATDRTRVTVWDPLPLLCEDAVCAALRAGRPLFFDGDHLSPYGNLVLLRPFKAFLNATENPTPTATAERSKNSRAP